MLRDLTGRIINTSTKFRGAWVINSKNTTNYTDKEETNEGTWFYDIIQSGCAVVWFVEDKKVA